MRRMTVNAGTITRLDPSRTYTLRRQWEADVARRFAQLRREILTLIVEEDALGLRQLVTHAESYFAHCPRDEKGHCESGSGKNDDRYENEGATLRSKDPSKEHLLLVDENGKIIHENTGDEGEVGYANDKKPSEVMDPSRKLVEHHTHPWDSPPSVGDLKKLANQPGVAKIVVHSPNVTYVVTPNLQDRESLWAAIDRAYIDAKTVELDNLVMPSDPQEREPARRAFHSRIHYGMIRSLVEGRIIQFKQFHPKQVVNADEPGRWITNNTRWQFHSAEGKVKAFLGWLRVRLAAIMGGDHHEDSWWHKYIIEGFKKGAARAFDDSRPKVKQWQESPEAQEKLEWYNRGTREEFLRSAFYHPVSKEKVQLLASRTFTDLKGTTESMAARIAHTLVDGLTRGANPREIGRDLAKEVDIGKARAQTIARTEIIRTHAEGQLDAFEKMGVTYLGVMAEWATAGVNDKRVCKLCRPLEGVVMTVQEAHGLLPRHPNCRCAWLPAQVGEKSKDQKKSKTAVERAIDASYKAELPKRGKRTLQEQKEMSKWGAADKTISKQRSKSILSNHLKTRIVKIPRPKTEGE